MFQYLDEDGRHSISSRDVNDYIGEFAGPGFTSKHFRTWAATVRAFGLFSSTDLPETKAARSRTINGIVDQVAARLGNTRSVCRQCYIHPSVLETIGDVAAAEENIGLKDRKVEQLQTELAERENTVRKHLNETLRGFDDKLASLARQMEQAGSHKDRAVAKGRDAGK